MNCATEKVSKVLKELEEVGLIYRKRNGRGKANYIYVMDYMSIYRRERVVQKGADDGEEIYKTNYIAPGTNVAIDGTWMDF